MALWLTFAYFATGVTIRQFWLDQVYAHFENDNSLAGASGNVGHLNRDSHLPLLLELSDEA